MSACMRAGGTPRMRAGKGQQKHGKRRGDDHGCIDTSEQAATGTHAGEGQTGMDLRPDKHTHTQAHSLADARAHQLARGGQGQREHERRLFAEEHGREKRGTCSRMASAFISLIRWALSVSKSSSSSRSTSVSLNAFTYTRTKASPREQRGPARRGLGRRGRKKRACSHALTR